METALTRLICKMLSVAGLFVAVLFGCRIVTVADFVFLIDDFLVMHHLQEDPVFDSLQNYTHARDCEVLILNQEHNYHYEVLESVLAFYPLPSIPSCNQKNLYFTFAIAFGEEKDFYLNRSMSWYEYATQSMIDLEYTTTEGQSRFAKEVFRNSSFVPHDKTEEYYDYQIRASCYCKSDDDIQWLFESDSHYCLFHEVCERAEMSNRSTWLNPRSSPSFFPSLLPQFHLPRRQEVDKDEDDVHHLCIVGEGKRREYDLVAEYLWNHPFFSGIHFHHFGIGSVQKPVQPFQQHFTLHPNPNFTAYQKDLYHTCDAILSLVTRVHHPEYFDGPMKLSGGIVQASAYRKPILLHKELAEVYASHLVNVETHDDDIDSFMAGFERLLDRLLILKAEARDNVVDDSLAIQ